MRAAADDPRRGWRPRLALMVYTWAWRVGWPLAALHLLLRSWRQPAYRRAWGERFFGHGPVPSGAGPRIWVHAVSVGETRAATPLIERLAAADPATTFVLTHMTPTGRETGAELARRFDGRLVQRYLPYDLPSAVGHFLDEVRPVVGVLIETEAWPNLLAGAERARVPVVLVNARLSARSLARGLRWSTLIRATAARLVRVIAQTDADAARIRTLYRGPIDVSGNLKFDLAPPPTQLEAGRAWHATLGKRPVWLFANTRDGEEALLLDAFEAAKPDARLVIVPRHPQRFDEVARIIAARGLPVLRRSDGVAFAVAGEQDSIVLGDSMGEMAFYYAVADVAFVGGSLAPLGGHNLIEACACGCPVVVGRHTFNFAQATADAIAAGAAVVAADATEVVAACGALAGDPDRLAAARSRALAFAEAHRGATERTVAIIRGLKSVG